jgi:hypothetical protein
MDTKHFRSVSKKWAFKLREDARDIEQEIIVFGGFKSEVQRHDYAVVAAP